MTKVGLLLVFLSFVLLNLHAGPKKPSWVKQRPSDTEYYTGIAFSAKTGSAVDYMQDARSRALRELSSEIKITISSSSILHQVENNTDIYHKYESKINSSILQTLEGYDIQTWEDKKEYWVMVRLSKSKYALRQQMKLDQAKMTASSLIDEAEKMVESNNPYTAIEFYLKAALALKNNLESDLTHRSVNGSRDLGITILQGLARTFQNMAIEPVQKQWVIGRAGVANISPSAQVLFATPHFDRQPASGVPVRFSFVSGSGTIVETGTSALDGMVSTSVTNLRQGIKRHQILMEPDTESLHKMFDNNQDLWKIFMGNIALPQAVVAIELEKVVASIEFSDVIFEGRKVCEALQRDIKSILSQNFFTFSADTGRAAYSVKVEPVISKSEVKKGQGYTVYIVYVEMEVAISQTDTGDEVFSHHISGIRGFQPGSFGHAIDAACTTMRQRFTEEVIPLMEQLDL